MQKLELTRRKFVSLLGTLGIGAGLAACSAGAPAAEPTPTAGMDMGNTQPGMPTPDVDQMDKQHEAGMKAFPAKTEGLGGQPLEFTMDGNTKVFQLTTKVVDWEVETGKRMRAYAYNGVVPGPEIRMTEGDNVRIVLKNELPESTSIHYHGVWVPNNMDGVPYLTQPPVKPGETFTYEFVARPSGSHMYHSHHNAAEQVTKGLLGAFIVEPKDKSKQPAYDKEYTMILNDGPLGFTLNGKSFPATQPLTARVGEKIRVRFMNEGLIIHPMHLHGMSMQFFEQDGFPLPAPIWLDTIDLAPGQRKDVLVDCQNPGKWAFHCHILSHAESVHGMFGMVTALIIE